MRFNIQSSKVLRLTNEFPRRHGVVTVRVQTFGPAEPEEGLRRLDVEVRRRTEGRTTVTSEHVNPFGQEVPFPELASRAITGARSDRMIAS